MMNRMSEKMTKDMAICLVVFNPAQTKRILMNYFYARSRHELQGLPVFTMELVYEGRTPEIPDAYHVKAKSYMFHKENLFRVLVEKIPIQYKKLAFLDSDILFKNSSWYEKTSNLLDTFNIVQPFEMAYWLDLTYKKSLLRKKTIVVLPKEKWSVYHHPGFAWCMQREWFQKYGFFDYALSGAGDILSCIAWFNKEMPKDVVFLEDSIAPAFEEYKAKLENPTISYIENMDIFHLYHGSRQNRKFLDRHQIISTTIDIRNLTHKNQEGILEWNDYSKLNDAFLKYFTLRKDDDLSTTKY
jgi:hypothetical protein